MALRQDRTVLDDDDFMLVEGSEDDNEKGAGAKVSGVMKSLAVLDTVVIVSRWCIPSRSPIFSFSVSELAPNACSKADHDRTVWPAVRYGGTMLGPVRFTHIEDFTRRVCDQIIVTDEIDDSIATLTNLDPTIAALRGKFDALRQRPLPPPPSARNGLSLFIYY